MADGMKVATRGSSEVPGWLEALLKDKEVFVFDWDETILDSMELISVNFSQAFCSSACGETLGDGGGT